MKKLSLLIAVFTLGLSSTSQAMRCSEVKVDEITCHKLRVEALKSGCINESHLLSFIKYASYPVCIESENKQTELMGWCPCSSQQSK